jgi:hypothetical protein
MPDGSYPIRDIGDLRNAIRSYGRAKKEDKPKVRRHIIKRARGLNRPDLIPDSWAKAMSASAKMQLRREEPNTELVEDALLALTASLKYRRPFEESRHPRDEHGRFRKVLFRLKKDLEQKTGTKEAIEKIEEAEDAEERGDDAGAQAAAEEVIKLVDDLADGTMDADDQEMLRLGGASLGEVLARLPLPQGQVASKMKFTDLPLELRDLVEDLVDRAAAKLDAEKFQEVAGPLKTYMAGGDYMDTDEVQSHLNRILRFLV